MLVVLTIQQVSMLPMIYNDDSGTIACINGSSGCSLRDAWRTCQSLVPQNDSTLCTIQVPPATTLFHNTSLGPLELNGDNHFKIEGGGSLIVPILNDISHMDRIPELPMAVNIGIDDYW